MPGPLDGLLVVDATWGMPGAVATLMLADYGARVVKLERPGGPDGVNRRAWDRGKWTVVPRPGVLLDLGLRTRRHAVA